MKDDERIVTVPHGSKIRLTRLVCDATEGTTWIQEQVRSLHLEPRSVEFGQELSLDGFRSEVWLEGCVSSDPAR